MRTNHKSKILNFYKTNKRMPSYQEIMNLLGYRSKNSVFKLVKKLLADKFVQKDNKGKLIPCQLYALTKILGTVEAGFPSPAEEELADTISLDEYLINNKDAAFLLKVSGDSMKDAGILPGDMVIVERDTVPRDGDIVVAEVDNEWTLKYFRKNNKKVFLEPANKKYKAIYPKDELRVAAVVKAVIRKY